MSGDFVSLGISDWLIETLREIGITTPTPVQSACIQPALDGRDILACSKTGSGKTLGFLIPLLTELSHDSQDIDFTDGLPTPQALVVAPTRELADQSFQVANPILYATIEKKLVK